MWKSASSVISSKAGISVGERSGIFRKQKKNGRGASVGQPELDSDSMRKLWVTAMDGVESSEWEDINDEQWLTSRTSISRNISSTSPSSLPVARQGGKLLQVVKRKVNFSRGTSKASQRDRVSVYNDKDSSSSRKNRTQDEIFSDKVVDEIESLKRELEKKEEELQKLNNEVSTLRAKTAIRSVQSQLQSQADTTCRYFVDSDYPAAETGPPDDTRRRYSADSDYPEAETSSQEDTSGRYSADSESSQLSCLDFSFAHCTGDLTFEGNIKTKIKSDSKPPAESGHQPDSIYSDNVEIGASLLVKKLSSINEGRSKMKCCVSSRVHEPDVVDKYVEVTKRRLDQSDGDISEPEYAARIRLNHTCGGVELSENTAKEDHCISTQSYVYETSFETYSDESRSRSPPTSTSSTLEEDEFESPIVFSDSDHFSVLQNASLSKVTNCVSATQSSCDLSDVEVEWKSRRVMMKDGGEVDDNSPAKENPLKRFMNSCVMLEVDKLSKTTKSLRKEESFASPKRHDRYTEPTPVISPRHRREESFTTTKQSDRIARSTSVVSPAFSRSVAAQVYPNRGVRVSQELLELNVQAGHSEEHPETEEFPSNWNEMDLRSRMLSVSTPTYEGSMEQAAVPNGLDFDDSPLRKSHRSCYGSTNPQSREHAKTIADRREDRSLVLSPTSRRSSTTADRHEGSSPISPPAFPRIQGLPRSSHSDGSQMLHEEFGWKTKSGRLQETNLEEEVRQILEQSRLLLMSDESSSEDELRVPGPAPSDKPFSVLTLSRQRRKREKSRTTLQYPSEINLQQEWPVQKEEQAMVLYGDANAWNIQSGKVDRFCEQDAGQGHDRSPSHPTGLRDAEEASYKKDDLQLVWELEVQNTKNLLPSASLPRRSRFFFEANMAKTPELV